MWFLPTQLTIVRYFVGGPGVLTAEDLARQDDELASKTDGFVLTSDLFRKAHLKLVDVLRDAGCSQVQWILCVSVWAQGSQETVSWSARGVLGGLSTL